jgi:hypothetical protein
MPIDPYSEQAGRIAEVLADIADRCGYPDCGSEVVGCAVHAANHRTESSFMPVCERHKGWEFAKLTGETIYL